jgi:hypothetical protein
MRELRIEHEGRGKGFRLLLLCDNDRAILVQGLGAAEVLSFIGQASLELREWGASGVAGVTSELSRVLKLVGGRRR